MPAGKTSFKVQLTKEGNKGKGQIHLADHGYLNPRWGLAYVELEDVENFVVKWYYGPHAFQHYDTCFHRIQEIPPEGWEKIKDQQEKEKEREKQRTEGKEDEEEDLVEEVELSDEEEAALENN